MAFQGNVNCLVVASAQARKIHGPFIDLFRFHIAVDFVIATVDDVFVVLLTASSILLTLGRRGFHSNHRIIVSYPYYLNWT